MGKIQWRRDRLPTPVLLGFPGGSADKEYACNAGDLGSIPGLGRSPGEGKGYPTPVFLSGEFQGLYCPRGHKQLDTTEGISLHSFTQSKLAQTRNGGSEARNLITLLGKIVVFIPVGCFGFPGGSDGKASACNAGNSGSIPGLGRSPGEGKGYPTPVFLSGEFHEREACRLQSMWLQRV